MHVGDLLLLHMDDLHPTGMAIGHTGMLVAQARPLTPDQKLIGPILAVPANPLPVDLERFVAGASSCGVVTVSMGTHAQLGACNGLPSYCLSCME